MKLVGLVTEYNPFHNGHLHHLTESLKATGADHSVAVMSGCFLQRGEIALLDKWTRAEMAVRSGVDLVVELPSLYAVASAETFAKGAILTLKALGCNSYCFGSEDGTLNELETTARALLEASDAFNGHLKSALKSGLSYPSAREEALQKSHGQSYTASSNNILGVEYLKASIQYAPALKPFTIPRIAAAYSETMLTGAISSATAIRHALLKQEGFSSIQATVPPWTYDALLKSAADASLTYQELLYPFIKYQLLTQSPETIARTHEVTEGLENKLTQCALTSSNLESLLQCAKSKRYTRTRLQRALINLLLNRQTDIIQPLLQLESVPYVRVLAFNQKGKAILRWANKQVDAPIMTNPNRFKHWSASATALFLEDVKATRLFRLVQGRPETDEDHRRSPIEVF